jgi:Domain of unknown function (DUF4112)
MSAAGKSSADSIEPTPVSGELLIGSERPAAQVRLQNEQWARIISHWTDTVFEVPGLGWRFGLDPIIGLIPVAGDVASALLSLYILSLAAEMRVPRSTMLRMAMNVAIDCVAGSIPLLGNVFDFAWKANHRNMQLLERTLAAPDHQRTRQTIWDGLFVAGLIGLLVIMLVGSIAVAVLGAMWIGRLLLS